MNTSDSPSPQPDRHASRPSPTSRWRTTWRWVQRGLVVLLTLNLLAMLMAFSTSVRPPAEPAEPVTVYLVDHGTTSSIALPSDDGGMIRYMYADWNYYVLDRRGIGDALAALLRPTDAALGRQLLAGPPGVETLRRQTGVEIEQIYALNIEHRRVEQLRGLLDEPFERQQPPRVAFVESQMEFVRHPQAYTYFHNSNHVTARWLREMGCEVRGLAFSSKWNVAVPPSD